MSLYITTSDGQLYELVGTYEEVHSLRKRLIRLTIEFIQRQKLQSYAKVIDELQSWIVDDKISYPRIVEEEGIHMDLHLLGMLGVYMFTCHSDHDDEWNTLQCTLIAGWLKKLNSDHELQKIFQYASDEQICVICC